MSLPANGKIRMGDWCVDPTAGQISRGDEIVRVEARTLRLLLDLAAHAGEVVSIDDLLERVWSGVIVTPDSVYQAVAALRRLLGDDPRRPRYIATVPRLGYRLVAKVAPWTDAAPEQESPAPSFNLRAGVIAAALGAVILVGGGVIYGQFENGRHSPASTVAKPARVAVLPFLDMTITMDQEALADEVTEGLADKLARNPALRTPGFRSSFDLKLSHNAANLGRAAKALGVDYLVDGTVRKTAAGLRVRARLVRASDGLVLWTQDYEGPLADVPKVQAAIAGGVARVLSAKR
jgi:transcriptional activator of cad operon